MKLAEATFRYAVVEQALMAVHGIVEAKKAAFRARLIHFQRLKIIPVAPGKGRRIDYQREDIFRWAVALEFAEFGMDPTEIKRVLDKSWSFIGPFVLQAKQKTDIADQYLFFHPNLLGSLSKEDQREGRAKPGTPYRIDMQIISDLVDLCKEAKSDEARAAVHKARTRYGMINLSSLRRNIDANLSTISGA